MTEIPIERKPRSRAGPWIVLLILLLVVVAVWYWWSSRPVVPQTGFLPGSGPTLAMTVVPFAERA